MTGILEAAPGMALDRIRSASTAQAHWPARGARRGLIQPKGEHRFRLRCAPDTAVPFPAGELTIVETHGGHACRLQTTPQPMYLDPEGALRLATELSTSLREAGFVNEERLDASRARTQGESQEHVRLEAFSAPHGSGMWRAELWLRYAVRRESQVARALQLGHDGCLITLHLWDPPLTTPAP